MRGGESNLLLSSEGEGSAATGENWVRAIDFLWSEGNISHINTPFEVKEMRDI